MVELLYRVESTRNYFHFWFYSWVEYEQIVERKFFLLEHGIGVELGRLHTENSGNFGYDNGNSFLDFYPNDYQNLLIKIITIGGSHL